MMFRNSNIITKGSNIFSQKVTSTLLMTYHIIATASILKAGILMLIHFSLSTKGGLEVFSYEADKAEQELVDPQLLSGFMNALQLYSEQMGTPITQMKLANMVLYIRTYGEFTLRLLFEAKMDEKEVDKYFSQVSKEIVPLMTGQISYDVSELKQRILPILAPLIEDSLSRISVEKESVSKIALAGLAKAGKTSIKRMFFENWSREMARDVKPTIGVETTRKFHEFLEHRFVIMDYGGQVTYREQHLRQEGAWRDLSALVYVVDLQDDSTYDEAKDYLSKIWKKITELNENNPKLAIFFHKYDISRREGLDKKMFSCIFQFKDFFREASFYMTTIEDASSTVALIKFLYFSLPAVVLKKFLEEEFIDHFENDVLSGLRIIPKFSDLIRGKQLETDLKHIKADLRRIAVAFGTNFGLSLQESWMKYLMGEWVPKRRLLTSKSVKISRRGRDLYITVPSWASPDFSSDFIAILIDGVLEGVFKTFHLDAPQKIRESDEFSTWRAVIC
ncbi:MAG: ADP-ribosylation factor-like protein [Candidatus Odinarchaeota archaeon]